MFYRKETQHVEPETLIRRRALGVRLLGFMLLLVFLGCGWKFVRGPTPWHRSVQERIQKSGVAGAAAQQEQLMTLEGWLKSDRTVPGVFRAREHAQIGWWWASAFGMGASFLLLITIRMWAPTGKSEGDSIHDVPSADEENKGDSGFAKLVSGRPIFMLLVFLAMVVGGWLRMPRLDHSLWNDEEYAMRKFAHGDYQKNQLGEPVFRKADWIDTLAENGNGNNHLLHSLLSRLSLDAWKKAWGNEPEKFSERWLRMPSYVAGLLTIVLVAWLGWEFGTAWVGVAAAWMLALHPWHIRYAVEAKGYSLMLFFIALCLLGLIRGQRDHSLRGWLMFAIGQAGFLTSFAGSIYVAVAINVMAVLEMMFRRQPKRLLTLVAFNVLAAIAVLFITLPSVPQIMAFVEDGHHARLAANVDWLRDLGAHVACGIHYTNPVPSEHVGTSWETMRHALPYVYGPLGWFLGALAALGLMTALFESAATRFVIVGLVLAGGLGFWHAKIQAHPNLSWYYVYLLIPLCLATGLAIVRFQFMPVVLSAMVVGLFAYATEQPRQIVIRHDRQQIRQTVDSFRSIRPHALSGVFGVSDKQAESYDPSVEVLTSVEQLEAMLARAQAGNQSCFIYFCGEQESKLRSPELFQRVTQQNDFALFKKFPGTEAMFSYYVYRCVGLGL